MLFNIVLEDALKSSPLLSQMIRRGDLIAYADDIAIFSSSLEELRQVLREFENLKTEWGLTLNRKKLEVQLMRNFNSPITLIDEIKVSEKLRYL